MVTQEEAEKLAQKILRDYVKSCGCGSTQDVANVLMKLAVFCGSGMCAVVGYEEGLERIEAVSGYIAKSEKDVVWKCGQVH